MRRVIKAPEPSSFTAWKSLGNEDWSPEYNNLQNPEKEQVHRSLLLEQGDTCCYCGRRVDLSSSHIEHFWPQHPFQPFALIYENLFASCMRDPPPRTELSCGHKKGKWFGVTSFLSPLDPNVEDQFGYTLDGQIIARSAPANRMILHLGLDASYLSLRRAQVLEGVFDTSFLETATREELARLVETAYERDENGTYLEFFQVIASFAATL